MALTNRTASAAHTWTSNTTNETFGHTPTGTPDVAFLCVAYRKSATQVPTVVTYGGQAMTQIGTQRVIQIDDGIGLSWYALASPPSGTQTVSVTWDVATSKGVLIALTYTGGDTATPAANEAGDTGTSTGPSYAVTSATGNEVLGAILGEDDDITYTRDNGSTQTDVATGVAVATAALGKRLYITTKAGAASVNTAYTLSASRDWVSSGINVRAGAGGGGPAVHVRPRIHRAVGGASRR
jgi:hypothetical protein